MKFLVVIFVMFVALVSAEYQVKTREDVMKYREECLKDHKLSDEELENHKHLKFADEPVTHCYMKCILEKFGIFDEEKGLNVSNVHQQMEGDHHPADHDDATHAKIEACAKEATGDNACARAYHGGMCLIREHLYLIRKEEHNHDHDHS